MSSLKYYVRIPNWQDKFAFSKATKPKYWLWKDRESLPKKYSDILNNVPIKVGTLLYCCDAQGERFIKNSKKAGKPNEWVLNGQTLYNAMLNWRQRKVVAEHYHSYFRDFIRNQLTPIIIPEGKYLSISCDIYEIKRGNMPDVSNMWLLEKFFEDALQEEGIIPDDNPDYVIESGRKKYHWVESPEQRALVFTIEIV